MDLQVEQRPPLQERLWRIQRVIWGCLVVFLALALAGVFGTGPLSSTTLAHETDAGKIEVSYESFDRRDHSATLRVRVEAPDSTAESLRVSFSSGIVDRAKIESVFPPASRSGFGPDGARYTFEVEDWSDPVALSFVFVATEAGLTRGTLGIDAGDALRHDFPFEQRVFP